MSNTTLNFINEKQPDYKLSNIFQDIGYRIHIRNYGTKQNCFVPNILNINNSEYIANSNICTKFFKGWRKLFSSVYQNSKPNIYPKESNFLEPPLFDNKNTLNYDDNIINTTNNLNIGKYPEDDDYLFTFSPQLQLRNRKIQWPINFNYNSCFHNGEFIYGTDISENSLVMENINYLNSLSDNNSSEKVNYINFSDNVYGANNTGIDIKDNNGITKKWRFYDVIIKPPNTQPSHGFNLNIINISNIELAYPETGIPLFGNDIEIYLLCLSKNFSDDNTINIGGSHWLHASRLTPTGCTFPENCNNDIKHGFAWPAVSPYYNLSENILKIPINFNGRMICSERGIICRVCLSEKTKISFEGINISE